MSGFVVWFDAELSDSVLLSTSPRSTPTHWKQTLLYLSQPLLAIYASTIEGKFTIGPHEQNHRGLKIVVEIKGPGGEYTQKQDFDLV